MAELLSFIESDVVWLHLSATLLGTIRIMIFVAMVPFLGPQVNTAVILPLVLAIYLPLHPFLLTQAAPISMANMGDLLGLLILILKEVVIGYILAYVCSCLFYAALSAGTIIDNQRGASMAQGSELLTGAESTPLGSVLFMAVVTLFFSSGAFVNFLSIFYETYVLWSPFALLPTLFDARLAVFTLQNLDFLMVNAVLLCGPFILVALMCDVSLGLINRFAPQLNVFILSMPIKSGICSLLIIFYLGPFLDHFADLFVSLTEHINELRLLLTGN